MNNGYPSTARAALSGARAASPVLRHPLTRPPPQRPLRLPPYTPAVGRGLAKIGLRAVPYVGAVILAYEIYTHRAEILAAAENFHDWLWGTGTFTTETEGYVPDPGWERDWTGSRVPYFAGPIRPFAGSYTSRNTGYFTQAQVDDRTTNVPYILGYYWRFNLITDIPSLGYRLVGWHDGFQKLAGQPGEPAPSIDLQEIDGELVPAVPGTVITTSDVNVPMFAPSTPWLPAPLTLPGMSVDVRPNLPWAVVKPVQRVLDRYFPDPHLDDVRGYDLNVPRRDPALVVTPTTRYTVASGPSMHEPTPPGPGTKEVKGRALQVASHVMRNLLQVTEWIDFLDILVDSISTSPPRTMSVEDRIKFVAREYDNIDLNKLFWGLVYNQAEDFVVGRTIGAADRARRELGIPISLEFVDTLSTSLEYQKQRNEKENE